MKLFKIICISLLAVGLLSFAYPVLAQDSGTSSLAFGAGVSSVASSSVVDSAQSNQPGGQSEYNILLISVIVIPVYALSYVLSKKMVVTPMVHRKIWNVILLVSTLAMLVLGLLLTLRVDYRLNIDLPFDMVFWHVEFGIIMGIIAVLHICWHWRYFTRLLKNGKQIN